MKTGDLIRAMAADTRRTPPVSAVLALALLVTAAATAGMFYSLVDMRPDFEAAIRQLQVVAKQSFPVLLALAALGSVLRLARPEGRLGAWGLALLVAPAVAAAAFALTAARLPPAAWAAEIAGHSRAVCLTCIPLIGLPILAGSLWALKRGASTRPALSGALAGLLSGGMSAAVYAFYCVDDSPMFWAVWYGLAILIVTAIGALVGRRSLRW